MNYKLIAFFLAVAFLALKSPLVAQGTSTFYSDYSQAYSPTDLIPSEAAGYWAVPFTFQSWQFDGTTGEYFEPKISFCYELLDGTGARVPGYPVYIYGGPFEGKLPIITSFDSITGVGQGIIPVPINVSSLDETWAHFLDGDNRLHIFYGSAGQMVNDGWIVPPVFEGEIYVDFSTFSPEFEVAVANSRVLSVSEPGVFVLVAYTDSLVDRTYDIDYTVAGVFHGPGQVTIPAGENYVSGSFVIAGAGQGRIQATYDPSPGIPTPSSTVSGPKLKVSGGPIRYVRNGNTAIDEDPLGDWFAKCVEGAGADGPEGEGGGNKQTFCGPCRVSDKPLSDCRADAGDHSAGFVYNSHCEGAFTSNICTISSQLQAFQVPVWEYDEPIAKTCFFVYIPYIGIVPWKKLCCDYTRGSTDIAANVHMCG